MKARLHRSMLKAPLPSSLWGVPLLPTLFWHPIKICSPFTVKVLKVTSKQIHCKNPSDKTSQLLPIVWRTSSDWETSSLPQPRVSLSVTVWQPSLTLSLHFCNIKRQNPSESHQEHQTCPPESNQEEPIRKSKLRDVLRTTDLNASKCQQHERPKRRGWGGGVGDCFRWKHTKKSWHD